MPLLKSSYLATSRIVKRTPDPVIGPLVPAGGTAWLQAGRGQHRAALDSYAAVLVLPREHPDVLRGVRRGWIGEFGLGPAA